MMEWEPLYKVALLSFLVGLIFGAVVNKTNFCTMGAVSDWVNMGNTGRLRAWFLAIGIATLLTQLLHFNNIIDISGATYLSADFGWLGYLTGGFIFGVGMTLASGCVNRTLVRVGGGNMKSLVVMIIISITAYMTMRGLLAPVKTTAFDVTAINFAAYEISDQGIGTLLSSAFGEDNTGLVHKITALVIGGGLIIYSLTGKELRHSFNNVFAGVVIGLLIPAGWYITGVVGFDDFEPVRLESFTFTGPTAEGLMYLLTFTGSTINFGITAVFGVILGSFLYVILTGKFRLETFTDRTDMIRHLSGAALMGFGGVLALGCTIGQGITGMSTLALGSLMTLASIIFGSALTMKVDYYLLDESGFFNALRCALSDMHLFPAARNKN